MNLIPMANPNEETKSDGLEILSIGSLYSGPWEKKYWSSSRGRDRYPYPVGYQALRTHKGLTYKMEIHEGSKGPLFQITSNDKHSGSGETPDRAWDNFQKKSCSRVKLWHGKRSSGKIDGVEFFGFKNALVQRLLRELVATVNDASEQSSPKTYFSEASRTGHDTGSPMTYKCLDLMPYLERTRVTGKRSRSHRSIDMKSACKSSPSVCMPQHQVPNAKVLCSAPRSSENDEPLISYAPDDDHDIDHRVALQIPLNVEHERNGSISGHELPLKSYKVSDSSNTDYSLAQEQREQPRTETCTSASLVNEVLSQEEKSEEILNVPQLHRQCIEVQGLECPVATEEGNGKAQVMSELLDYRSPVLKYSQVNHYGDLCAPDTYDAQQEITSPPDSVSHHGQQSIEQNVPVAADMMLSEEPITGSHSEEGNANLNANSETSDFDSLGEEITKSMLSLLLPEAIPLLTYSSRKKRRKPKPSKGSPCEVKLENVLEENIPSTDVIAPAEAAGSSGVKGKIMAHVRGMDIDSAASMLDNFRCIVPDSLDDDHCEAPAANQLSPSHRADAVAAHLRIRENAADRKGSSVLADATNPSYCHNQTNEFKEIFSHKELPTDCNRRPEKDCVLPLHSSVGCTSPSSLIATSDKCLNADADNSSKCLDICCKKTELDDALDCEGKINDDSGLRSIPVSEKQQSTPGNGLVTPSPVVVPLMGNYNAPLSESIICRNMGDNCVSENYHAAGNLVAPDSCQVTSSSDRASSKVSFGVGDMLERETSQMLNENIHEFYAQNSKHCVSQDPALSCTLNKVATEFTNGPDLQAGNALTYVHKDKIGDQECESVGCSNDQGRGSHNYTSDIKEGQADIHASPSAKLEHDADREGIMKLIGRYSHPRQISSVMLTTKAHDIYICVSCGLLEERKRELFLYKLLTKEPSLGKPYLVGHTSMDLPVLKDEFGRQVAIDKYGLQITPDARGLVLADSIRMPYCREKNLCCSCQNCESCCFEENAVKIVQIEHGYVSLVLKLNTIYPVHCVLVFDPDRLIAVDESGRIYIWVMNPTWSLQTEEYVIPSYDCLPSRIVELKRIPKSASMVVGHNGYGEFSLWDILKRTVVSRFSAPAGSVFEFLPVSLFSWQNKGLPHDKHAMEECVEKFVEASMLWFSGRSEENISSSMEGECIAVWLLIYTSSDSGAQSGCSSSNYRLNPDGCWRLGLLIKNIVVLGAALHSSAAAIGTASGHGIIGTEEGHLYIWELATGAKLGTLHDFGGGRISHIATDDSTSSAIAIARDGQLWVYLHT